MKNNCPSLFLIIAAAMLIPGSCANKAEPSRTEFIMDTVCSVTLYDQAKAGVYRDIFSRLREIENRMSSHLPDSDIVRINNAAGIAPVQVHDDVFTVLEKAVHYAEISGGAFNPAVGPLVSLWGINGDNPRVPSQEEIDTILPLINWRDIELNRENNSVFLRKPGMALDLGAIAKGYAADEAEAIIRNARLKRAIIDLGGNIMIHGVKRDNSSWRIGIQDPFHDRGNYFGIVSGAAQTVVTSGVYERYFEAGGVRYHHIFSPSNGYPVHNGLLAVTIIAGVSIDADALSTAVFVLGYEQGRALIESLEGIEALFVFEDKSVRKTRNANFELIDTSYTLVNDSGEF